MNSSKHWIQLPGGRQFWPLEAAGIINLCDVASGLSKICRYTGAIKTFYSVAQHAINCSRMAPPELKAWALHHDDPEYVLNDVARPLKHRWFMRPYRRAERKLMRRIAGHLGLTCEDAGYFGWNDPVPPEVKEIDTRMMATEVRHLFKEVHPDWSAWLGGVKPYDLPEGAFVSRLPTGYFEAEFLGLAELYSC